MVELQGQPGELRFTLQITRKETGRVEEVELVGFIDEAKFKELTNGRGDIDGRGAGHSDNQDVL